MFPVHFISGVAILPALECTAHLDETLAMTKGEWVVQLIKIAIGIAIGLYFIWWSLEMLHRLPPH
jgi:hypothetical protein